MIEGDDLRQPGRVLLVSCYELGHAPHGLAMPLGFLRRAGYLPAAVDTSVERLDDAAIDQAVVVLFSVPMHTALRLALALAARIRQRNPGARQIFFGHYAVMNREHLRTQGADRVLGGEHEADLVRLLDSLDTGATFDAAPVGLGKLDFPAPARDRIPLDRYARLELGDGSSRTVGYVETSRGCLDTCRHCPLPAVYGGRFFVVPQDRVLEDIAAQVEAGAEHITFGDPDFLNGPGHALAIVRALHARWPALSFDVTAQVTHLLRHQGVLAELAASGCAFVVSAVESLSDRVLERLRKRHRRAQVEELLSAAAAAGLVIRPTFVTFTPWTELDDLRALVDFLAAHDLYDHVDPVQLSIRLLVPPGSLLLEAPETRTAFGPLDPAALGHSWVHPDRRVDQLQQRIAARVEDAAARSEDPDRTFDDLRALVHEALGLERPAPRPPRVRRRAPRLSEPWFC